jgi:hypothetical protein
MRPFLDHLQEMGDLKELAFDSISLAMNDKTSGEQKCNELLDAVVQRKTALTRSRA